MKILIYKLSLLLIILFSKYTHAQQDSELLSQLFYGVSDVVEQAVDFVSLSVDAVWYASEVNNTKTTTGTLKQSTSNPDVWTYSSSPYDKMVLVFSNNATVNFKFDEIDGFVDKTAEDFKNSNSMDFVSEIPGLINLRIKSRIGPFNNRIEWNRTITGSTVIGETKVNVDFVNTGYRDVEVSGGFAFGNYYDQNIGSASTSYSNFSISESYKTQLGHNSNDGIFVQSIQIICNNSATGDFGSFKFNNADCFWVGGTRFADSARVGIYNKAIEVYNWSASGQLLKNGQNYGTLMYDRQVYENSEGAYIMANCVDGKKFYLYRALYPLIISGIEANNNLNKESLSQNYPNPFSSETTICYYLARESDVKIKIFNSSGQTIEVLVSERQPSGKHSIEFSAKDLIPGIYYYQIETDIFSETRKMLLKK